jgi:hypothetical protein
LCVSCHFFASCIPDGKHSTGFGETSLFLNTTDSLLKDRRDFGWGCFGIGGVGTFDSVGDCTLLLRVLALAQTFLVGEEQVISRCLQQRQNIIKWLQEMSVGAIEGLSSCLGTIAGCEWGEKDGRTGSCDDRELATARREPVRRALLNMSAKLGSEYDGLDALPRGEQECKRGEGGCGCVGVVL